MTSPLRQRLPCVALLAWSAAGVLAGRFVEAPGWVFAAGAAAALVLALRFAPALPVGVAFAFAAAQAWTFRESAAVALARELGPHERAGRVVFTVLEAPRVVGERARFLARLDEISLAGRTLAPRCRVFVVARDLAPAYGDRYETTASILPCPPPRNPGEFNYAAWLANRGVRSEVRVPHGRDARRLGTDGHALTHVALASRDWVERTLTHGIAGTNEAALILGMTVGDTSDASDALKEDFRETGTFHLFSVSGLHVGIVAVILWTALGLCGVSQRRSVLIVIPALFFYALLTGLSAASVRAATMLAFVAAGLLLDRPTTALNSIGAAGLVLLMFDSSQLFNSGFQLSFGAVTAIILLASPGQRFLQNHVRADPFLPRSLVAWPRRALLAATRYVVALTVVSIAAWLATLPLTALYFHLVSFSAIPANLFAVPLSGVVLALAALSLLVGLASPWLAEVFNQANFLVAKILLAIVQGFAAIPGSAIYVGPPEPPGVRATLTALDAGPGGASVLRTGGVTWLVDTGNAFFARSVTIPFLRSLGVNHLDALVLTHGDARHIGGAAELLQAFPTHALLDSGLRDRSPTRRNLLALRPATDALVAGWSTTIGAGARIRVLYPPEALTSPLADDKAVVLRVEVGTFRALLLSDAGTATEEWLVRHARDALACDLVVMGRHLSSPAIGPDLLRAASPRLVITTAATFPERELPGITWVDSVRALGIELLRQDETGAVTVNILKDAFTATPFLPRGGSTRTFQLPDAPAPPR